MPVPWKQISAALPAYLLTARWFSGKSRVIQDVARRHEETLRPGLALLVIEVCYEEGKPELYQLPLAHLRKSEWSPLAGKIVAEDNDEVVVEAAGTSAFGSALLDVFAGSTPALGASLFAALDLGAGAACDLPVRALSGEQSNTCLVYGNRYIVKLYRRLEAGENPDVEVGRRLTALGGYQNTPLVLGAVELCLGKGSRYTLASLHRFVANEGDAWTLCQRQLKDFSGSHTGISMPAGLRPPSLREYRTAGGIPQEFEPSASQAALLGKRVAEMHKILAAPCGIPEFEPESLSEAQAAFLAHKLAEHLNLCCLMAGRSMESSPKALRGALQEFLDLKPEAEKRLAAISGGPLQVLLTRTHGDLHLGQVLVAGDDFFIIDFEGEPSRPLADRRVKHSPLRDVAGMVRSFDYAISVSKFEQGASSAAAREWLQAWRGWVSASFLRGYLETTAAAPFLPASEEDLFLLLDVFLIEKALYELTYELNNRPHWVTVPLTGLLSILRSPHG